MIVVKIIVIKHLMKISPTTKCAISADYYFPYLFSFCLGNPSERLCGSTHNVIFPFLTKENASASWIYRIIYREFLVSFGVVADLKCVCC